MRFIQTKDSDREKNFHELISLYALGLFLIETRHMKLTEAMTFLEQVVDDMDLDWNKEALMKDLKKSEGL